MEKIPRRDFLKISGTAGGALAAWPLTGLAGENKSKSGRPNFIVYISDDHGTLFSEPYGNADIHTPHLTRLAAEGVTFTHAFNASPSCGPSRTAMLTALWPARNGAMPNHQPPRPGVEGLPEMLQSLGYETAVIGKVAHNDFAKYFRFDYAAGPNLGATNTAGVARFLAERDASKPLCLFFGAHFPHTPWIENRGYDPAKLTLPPTWVDTPAMREQYARYASSVTATDKLLGEYRELVKKYVPGDSLFIYTVDHGAQMPFSKWDLYDAGIRVPFIASWPGKLKPGTKNEAMISLPDLLPTFIELAGGMVPAGLDGKSFAGLLLGTTATHRDQVFTAHWGDGHLNVYPCRSVRTRDWKYIRNLHPEFQHHTHISLSHVAAQGWAYWESWLEVAKADPTAAAKVNRYIERPAEELYDLNADPYEQNNLAADPRQASRLAAMRAEVTAWMKQQGDVDTVFGQPILIGQPVTPIGPKSQPPARRNADGPGGGPQRK